MPLGGANATGGVNATGLLKGTPTPVWNNMYSMPILDLTFLIVLCILYIEAIYYLPPILYIDCTGAIHQAAIPKYPQCDTCSTYINAAPLCQCGTPIT